MSRQNVFIFVLFALTVIGSSLLEMGMQHWYTLQFVFVLFLIVAGIATILGSIVSPILGRLTFLGLFAVGALNTIIILIFGKPTLTVAVPLIVLQIAGFIYAILAPWYNEELSHSQIEPTPEAHEAPKRTLKVAQKTSRGRPKKTTSKAKKKRGRPKKNA